ncbi:hypothetical protein CPC08DRAFT_712704 [Agrocybe pediades]|nr:hypothetical protein CPC08DRAFT_712704 [Agrocybe pediades]
MAITDSDNGTNHRGVYIGAIIAGVLLIVMLCCARTRSRRRATFAANNIAIGNSQVRYQTAASLNHRCGAPILPLHSQQPWTAPAPPYSPPSSPPAGITRVQQNLTSPTSPSFPLPVHAHDDPAFPIPSVRAPQVVPPTSPSAEPDVKGAIPLPANAPSTLVDRMREVQTLMLEIHTLESEGGSNNNERIQELQRRVAQLSRTDGNSASVGSSDPPPYFPPAR